MQQVLLCWNTPQHTDEQGRASQDDEEDEDDDDGGRRWFEDEGWGREETTVSSRGSEATLLFPAPPLGGVCVVSHGCRRQSEALAREAGSYASMGSRKSANACASAGVQSYFSVSTSYRPQGFRLLMCLSSPRLLKNSLEYRPEKAMCLGISPRSSMMWARWSSSRL